MALLFSCVLVAASALAHVGAQEVSSSFPHVYPGQPSGGLSPEWQNYFQVNDSLPNVTFPLTRSFAGNIPVNRPGHDNDTLFFWAFEKENGSLTTNGSTDPWLIWLQGGPGSSSLLGLFLENGPLRLQDDLSLKYNNYSWSNLADTFWVDNPVGVGFSTADATGYVLNAEQAGTDFVQFLANLVKVFPSLATRPLILAGESYAGQWIPYVTKAIFSTSNPPVQLKKMVIGDGTIGAFAASTDATVVSVIETYPQIVNYDTDVLDYFREQTHLCGFDLNLTYPQTGGHFPTLEYPGQDDQSSPFASGRSLTQPVRHMQKRAILESAFRSAGNVHLENRNSAHEAKKLAWKRDLSLRANGTIDPWYGCFLQTELFDYMVNFTMPWSADPNGGALDVYDITDGLAVKPPTAPSGVIPPNFFIDNRTVAALHAPTSKQWAESINYPFNSSITGSDTSPEPQTFLDELAANASTRGVGIVLYSGNDDALLPHHGTEVAIQNTTFGGTQGFTLRPQTPWNDDTGAFAGIVHQERNWTYVLFKSASHLVPQKVPGAAYVFLREFVLGNNQTGLVVSGLSSPIGGNATELVGDILPGTAVFGGSLTPTTTFTYPAATVSAWDSFISSAGLEDSTAVQTSDTVTIFSQNKATMVVLAALVSSLFVVF